MNIPRTEDCAQCGERYHEASVAEWMKSVELDGEVVFICRHHDEEPEPDYYRNGRPAYQAKNL